MTARPLLSVSTLLVLCGCPVTDKGTEDTAPDLAWLDEATLSGGDSSDLGASTLLATTGADGATQMIAGAPAAHLVRVREDDTELKLSGSAETGFGTSLTAGDLDGDAETDLLVSSPSSGFDTPAVYLVPGPVDKGGAIGTLASSPVSHEADGDALGWALATGDIDADEQADLLVGAPSKEAPDGGDYVGFALLYLGPLGEGPESAAYQVFPVESGSSGSQIGAAVALADLDGDGIADLIVGAPSLDIGAGYGSVGVQRSSLGFDLGDATGPEFPTMDSHVFAGEPGDGFGSALATGDWNADGVDDLLVGAPSASAVDGSAGGGAAWLYLGATDFSDPAAEVEFRGPESGDAAGTSVGFVAAGSATRLALIGAPGTGEDAGAVYVEEGALSGTVTLEASAEALVLLRKCPELIPHEPDSYALFGTSLSTTISASSSLVGVSVGAPGAATAYGGVCTP